MSAVVDSSSIGTSSSSEFTWIKWNCGQPENQFLAEVDTAYIEDSFNLYGIRSFVPSDHYYPALEIILDKRGEILTPLLFIVDS